MSNWIVYFNSYDHGSTGSLCASLKNAATKTGYKTIFVSGGLNEKSVADYYLREHSNLFDRKLFEIFSKNILSYKYIGIFAFKRMVNFLKTKINFKEDNVIFHLHNMQYSGLNVYLLLEFCLKNRIKVVWTLHDCWPFTGGCNHYEMIGCVRCNIKCKKCPLKIRYASCFFKTKQRLFSKLSGNLLFVAPSAWVKKELEKNNSNLKCCLINNGIDATIWSNNITELHSNPRIICVSSIWNESKGIRFVNELATRYHDSYEFYVVGLKKGQQVSSYIKSFGKVNAKELKDLYCSSDLFLNPTLEDTFPTVNIEALLCGLPIVSFNTGGSCEIFDNNTGVVVYEKTVDALYEGIKKVLSLNISKETCRKRGEMFSKNKYIDNHLNLYKKVLENRKQ